MARDEALLELREVPTLRFYRWLRPTLSLGYFQPASTLPLEEFRAQGFDVVRRSTGGKAILHQHELTYSLCLPERGALSGGPAAAMTAIHQALSLALEQQAGQHVGLRDALPQRPQQSQRPPQPQQRLLSDSPGSAWCFEDSSALDLVLAQRKLLGSAARRKHGWVLFHGSLVIHRPDCNPDIAELGFEPDQDGLTEALGTALGYDFQNGEWSLEERQASAAIEQQKYATESFTMMR
jgi:lipoate-protein ligase A